MGMSADYHNAVCVSLHPLYQVYCMCMCGVCMCVTLQVYCMYACMCTMDVNKFVYFVLLSDTTWKHHCQDWVCHLWSQETLMGTLVCVCVVSQAQVLWH